MKTAYDMMGQEGLESIHARTVAAKLGINHATVHYYFPNRTDLLLGVAEFALEQFAHDRERFHAGLTAPSDKLEAELALGEAYCKKSSRFAKVLAGLYVASIESPEIKKQLKLLWKEWSSLVTELCNTSDVNADSPYTDGELLTATLFGFALASQMVETKFDAKTKIDSVFASMFP